MDRNEHERDIPRGTDESESEARRTDARPDARPAEERSADTRPRDEAAEPPHTTTGKITSPKFGSAGSGGLEYEGNFDRD